MAQVNGIMAQVNGVDQPINLAISFAQDEITQIQGHRWVRKALIALGHPLPQKRLQIGFFLGFCTMEPSPLPFVPPRAYQTLG
jgi:hypothetical protein